MQSQELNESKLIGGPINAEGQNAGLFFEIREFFKKLSRSAKKIGSNILKKLRKIRNGANQNISSETPKTTLESKTPFLDLSDFKGEASELLPESPNQTSRSNSASNQATQGSNADIDESKSWRVKEFHQDQWRVFQSDDVNSAEISGNSEERVREMNSNANTHNSSSGGLNVTQNKTEVAETVTSIAFSKRKSSKGQYSKELSSEGLSRTNSFRPTTVPPLDLSKLTPQSQIKATEQPEHLTTKSSSSFSSLKSSKLCEANDSASQSSRSNGSLR